MPADRFNDEFPGRPVGQADPPSPGSPGEPDIVLEKLAFQFDELPPEGLIVKFALPPDFAAAVLGLHEGAELIEEPRLVSPLSGQLTLVPMSQRLLVKGRFGADLVVACDRCLEESVRRVDSDLDEALNFGPAMLEDPALAEEDGDAEGEDHWPIKDGQFDLAPLVAEYFWLNWPYQVLCRENCAGLCVGCGANLNSGLCQCPPQEAVGPWAKLAKLKEN